MSKGFLLELRDQSVFMAGGGGRPESKVSRHQKYFEVKRVGIKRKLWKEQSRRRNISLRKNFAADAAYHILNTFQITFP